MIDRLNSIYAKTNFAGHPYASLESATLIGKQLKASQEKGNTDFNLLLKYAIESMNAGKTSDALNVFNYVNAQLPQFQKVNEQSILFYKLWAISWMRKGEEENCIANHSEESCVFPIRGKGIHVKKEGSRNAIKLYQQILEKYPNDMESRWLINIAYMLSLIHI